jgi:hypothetical protein
MTTTDDPRALSIRQPWTDLLLSGEKRVENRTWSTAWRGELVLHAGKQQDPRGRKLAAERGIVLPAPQTGAYLGCARLVDVHPDAGCCREVWGEPDCWHWVVTNPRRFAEPIAGLGKLGLYRPPLNVIEAITTTQETHP